MVEVCRSFVCKNKCVRSFCITSSHVSSIVMSSLAKVKLVLYEKSSDVISCFPPLGIIKNTEYTLLCFYMNSTKESDVIHVEIRVYSPHFKSITFKLN